MARKTPKEIVLHGHTRIDEYAWLRDRNDPEVIKHLEAENVYTAAAMKDTEDFQKKLYDEMLGRIQETDLSVPYRDGDYFYYSRTEKGKQYPLLARKLGSLEAPEQVYLDLNVLAEGKSYFRLGALALSPDHLKVAYSADTDGSEVHTTYVKDLKTGELLADRITRTAALVWANDNKMLFYTTIDEAKRPYRFYRHELGAAPAGDELLFEEKDELYNIWADRTKSDGYILLNSASSTTTEVRYLPAARPREALRIVHPREKDHRYEVDHHGRLFYIVTNSGAKDFRLMTAPIDKPDKKRWKEVLPARQGVKLERVELFKDTLVAVERQNGLPRLRVVDLKSGNFHYIEFPESAYSASVFNNLVWDTDLLRFNYASLVTPSSVYDYNLKTHDRVLLKRQPVLGSYDPALYQAERIAATAADGTKIPVSIVYKKGTPLDGSAPLWLNGYGSYGSSIPVTFNSNRLSLLDRGVIVALAHIRGGGDLGEEWHESGKLMNKKNTFTDFVAAAEHLIAKKYTRSDRLVIQGGSAGGLLIGATVNLRPDLFRAAIANVPFVDVMNTMLDATLPLTVGEYLEWGNPNEKAAYEYMVSYDPYSNIKAQPYPAVLITAGLNDPRVGYWEGAKFAARLRATKTDDNVLLLKTNLGAGHSGSSGRYDRLKEIAFEYAFLLKQVGIQGSSDR
ncbi:MAG: S9 family peptidase [Acidobacteriota bacterium]